MCSVCNQQPCPVGCPERSDIGIYRCGVCHEGICDGERYYKIGNACFHRDCLLDRYDKDELLQLLKGPARVATPWSLIFGGDINE